MKALLLLLLALSPLASLAKKSAENLVPLVAKVSRAKFEVSKSRMEKDVKDPQAQLSTFRALPSFGMGYISGIEVSRFGKNCLLPSFGIKEGDVIETVNGQQLGGLGDIMAVGQKLAKAKVGSVVRINIRRGGQDLIQSYLIVE
ncbi:MAG: hypothetical protein AB7K68_09515 [Bacteriovoracia bacterium]